MSNGNGESKIINPKRRLEPVLPVADFEDVISQLVGDPNCRTCFGRYWVGFTKHTDGSIKLDLCHCASFAETQVVKVLRAVAVMANDQDGTNKAILEILTRTEKTQGLILEMLAPKPGLYRRALEYVKNLKNQVDSLDYTKQEEPSASEIPQAANRNGNS